MIPRLNNPRLLVPAGVLVLLAILLAGVVIGHRGQTAVPAGQSTAISQNGGTPTPAAHRTPIVSPAPHVVTATPIPSIIARATGAPSVSSAAPPGPPASLMAPAAPPGPLVAPASPPAPLLASTGLAPLDGLPTTRALALRRPLAIMVENFAPDSRPQTGLGPASVVFETVAEFGITRFMAVYQEHDAPVVGPVRSARVYYDHWAEGLHAIFAHAGGNSDALRELWGLSNLVNIDEVATEVSLADTGADYYFRINRPLRTAQSICLSGAVAGARGGAGKVDRRDTAVAVGAQGGRSLWRSDRPAAASTSRSPGRTMPSTMTMIARATRICARWAAPRTWTR